ncbi:hypothetical protein GCM10022631_34200 [Deinococcus rubellus]|uniref:Uncharacterized protein n=1 Tax=Deinococcus rubellus TaxID=1889240 RepID=A0ABY5YEG1_9DEIO|nr:hypothetical protein [Deinococcus rubellus]UWX63479.1 hypothetical protein N0D28_12100 [Deinococcus rubellus]
MLKAHSSDVVAAVIFIRAEYSGGVVLDSQGLRHAPIGPDDWRMIEANLLLFEAAQLIKDPLAAQYMRQAAQDRLREQAAKLLEPE